MEKIAGVAHELSDSSFHYGFQAVGRGRFAAAIRASSPAQVSKKFDIEHFLNFWAIRLQVFSS